MSAVLRVPWQSIIPAAAIWGLVGCAGVVYAVIVARRVRAQAVYQPEFEDWSFHVLLPLAAYATLTVAAFAAPSYTREALFAVGGAALLLLFASIHNDRDSFAYHAFASTQEAHADRHDNSDSG